MKNLTQLSVDCSLDLDCLLKLLHRNQDTLKVFNFYVDFPEDWARFHDIWNVVAGMEHIKDVFIEKLYVDSSDNATPRLYLQKILSLVGWKLETFSVRGLDDCVDLITNTNLPIMNTLMLFMSNKISDDNWGIICYIKHLKKCEFEIESEKGEIKETHILHLVKSLPKLVELTIAIKYYMYPLTLGVDLKQYLYKNNRVLKLIFKVTQ